MVTIKVPTAISGISRAQNKRFYRSTRLTPPINLIDTGHWIRDTQLHEDAHRYRGNGAGVMATLRTAALNLLRLGGLQSIRAGM